MSAWNVTCSFITTNILYQVVLTFMDVILICLQSKRKKKSKKQDRQKHLPLHRTQQRDNQKINIFKINVYIWLEKADLYYLGMYFFPNLQESRTVTGERKI